MNASSSSRARRGRPRKASQSTSDRSQRPKKLRRITRACDYCHRRSIRCRPSTEDPNRCRNCVDFGVSCTYNRPVHKRGLKTKQKSGEGSSVNGKRDAKSSSSLLHHFAGIAATLGSVTEGPLSELYLQQVRETLAAMADLLATLEASFDVRTNAGASLHLREQITAIEKFMAEQRQAALALQPQIQSLVPQLGSIEGRPNTRSRPRAQTTASLIAPDMNVDLRLQPTTSTALPQYGGEMGIIPSTAAVPGSMFQTVGERISAIEYPPVSTAGIKSESGFIPRTAPIAGGTTIGERSGVAEYPPVSAAGMSNGLNGMH